MTNAEIAQIFAEMGDILEIQGQDRYRFLAYRRAAQEIARYPTDVTDLWRAGKLEDIPSVGKTLAAKIDELLRTGQIQAHQRLIQEVPPSIIEVLRIPGVGPKRAQQLWKELGITSIAELEAAARDGRLAGVKGMGEQTVQNIVKGIESVRAMGDRIPLGVALPLAQDLVAALLKAPGVHAADMAGSLRRRCETVGDIDLLVAADDTAAVIHYFTHLPQVKETRSAGDNKATIALPGGLTVDLMALPPQNWGSLLQHFTGSKQHNVQLRTESVARGLHVSEWGITGSDGVLRTFTDEAEVYHALGMDWIPPELREASGEIEAARAHKLPHLVTLADIRGDLQMHTTYSDGATTVEGMARAAQVLGYAWIAITDHSHSLAMTGGLDVERARQQAREIAEVNAKLAPFRVLRSVELEILADGSLDLPDEALAEFDIVVASAHTGQRGERATLMRRYLAAMRSPHVDIIGHPFGRILGKRPPMDLDFEALVEAAAETGTALEINGQVDRLDLNGEQARYAAGRGVMITLASDAHAPEGLGVMTFAVEMARRGWLEPKHILNTRSLAELEQWLRR